MERGETIDYDAVAGLRVGTEKLSGKGAERDRLLEHSHTPMTDDCSW